MCTAGQTSNKLREIPKGLVTILLSMNGTHFEQVPGGPYRWPGVHIETPEDKALEGMNGFIWDTLEVYEEFEDEGWTDRICKAFWAEGYKSMSGPFGITKLLDEDNNDFWFEPKSFIQTILKGPVKGHFRNKLASWHRKEEERLEAEKAASLKARETARANVRNLGLHCAM